MAVPASRYKCCVPNCNVTRNDQVTLHSFPNPEKDPARFRSWLYAIGGDLLALDNNQIYKQGRVCHHHFETQYRTWTKMLSPNAVPTLHLPGFPSLRPLLKDITNKCSTTQNVAPELATGPSKSATTQNKAPELAAGPSKSACLTSVRHTLENMSTECSTTHNKVPELSTVPSATSANKVFVHKPGNSNIPLPESPKISLKNKSVKRKKGENDVPYLKGLVNKLTRKTEKYARRLKKATTLAGNPTFQRCLKNFTTLAAMFTLMQFREINKPKMGRRFNQEEKLMALSLYKQGPRAYRWLSRIFVLPSPLTLSRLISKAGIKPGINKKIFDQLAARTQNMNQDEKLCILLFDEISISPNLEYNRKADVIKGFSTNGTQRKRQIADHALVFMIRGAIKNYKQPIAYIFCTGTTQAEELKILIKNVIRELHKCGFIVLATVCDQGSTNVSAINKLITETRADYSRQNLELRREVFEVDGEEVIPLFDTPHLMKGIRNNMLNKNLKCVIEGVEKIAKWDHIQKLYEENPAYKGIRLIKKLSEIHVDPKKISKMKVKLATQVFSKTVATNMGYLADKGILPKECQDTADVLLFFDDLFDSMNGSFDNSRKRSGKPLLRAVTPTSQHTEVWRTAKYTLKSMKFVTNTGKIGSVPSVSNWVRTLDNMEYLKDKIFNKFNFKSLWMRHFNQDPLENFFGSIRSHGGRNVSPTPSGFEAAFISLLISNVTKYHSKGANCEEDFCNSFDSMATLLSTKEEESINNQEIDFDDLNCNIENFETKKGDPKIYAQITYVTGYVLRQTKNKVFKSCKECKKYLFTNECLDYISKREYVANKKHLTYPSKDAVIFFSEIQDVAYNIITQKSNMLNIKNYIKTIIYSIVNFNFLSCETHKKEAVEFMIDLSTRFFIVNWCRDVNKILNGTRTDYDENDIVKKMAYDHYKKNKKH